jgi:hypothetical protein
MKNVSKWAGLILSVIAVALLVYGSLWAGHSVRVAIQCRQYGYSQWRVDPDFEAFCAFTVGKDTKYRELIWLDPENSTVRY